MRRSGLFSVAGVKKPSSLAFSLPLISPTSHQCISSTRFASSSASTSASWTDIGHDLPSAIATREVDVLLTKAYEILNKSQPLLSTSSSSSTSSTPETHQNDLLTLETAVGLLQASRFADIEIRSTEKFERHSLFVGSSSSSSNISASAIQSPPPPLIQHSVPLFLSSGVIPLSLRRPVSDGTATTRLLSEFLIHPNFISSPAHQAILVDAAGQTLDRLASTVCADAVEEFCLCASSTLELLNMESVENLAMFAHKRNANSKKKTVVRNTPESSSNNFLEIFSAEKQMVRESWRRFQKSISRVDPVALTASVQAELATHLSLAKKCNLDTVVPSEEDSSPASSSSRSLSSQMQKSERAVFRKYQKMMKRISLALVEGPVRDTNNKNGTTNNDDSGSRRSPDENDDSSSPSAGQQRLSQEEALATASSQLLEEVSLFDFPSSVDAMNLVCAIVLRKLPSDPHDSSNGSYMHQLSSKNRKFLSCSSSSSSSSSIAAFDGVIAASLQQLIAMTKGISNICPQGEDWNQLRDSTAMAELIARHLCDIVAGETRNGDEVFSSSENAQYFDPLRGYHLLKFLHKCHALSLSGNLTTIDKPTEEENDSQDADDAPLPTISTLRLELQQLVKNLFPRGTSQQQTLANTSSSSSLPSFLQSNTTNNVTGVLSTSLGDVVQQNNNLEGGENNNNIHQASLTIGTTTSDYPLLQHAHVAVIGLSCFSCNESKQQQENENENENDIISNAEQCYFLISSHKYYGVKITSKMMLPMLKILSPLGDSRVFNAIDVCTLFSGCSVTDEVLAEAFKTCAAAGDHHRARQLVQLLKNDIPGVLSKIPKDGVDALVSLGVVKGLANTWFDDDEKAMNVDTMDEDRGCLKLNLAK